MKKYILLFTVTLILLSVHLTAQNLYKSYSQPMRSCQVLIPSNEGGYYMAGQDSSFDIAIAKISGNGQIVWDKTIGSPAKMDYLTGAILISSNRLILSGWSWDNNTDAVVESFLYTLDSAGNYLDSKRYGDNISTFSWLLSLIRDGNGYSLTNGFGANGFALGVQFIKFDAYSNIIDANSYDWNSVDMLYRLPNGNYIWHVDANMIFNMLDSSFNLLFGTIDFTANYLLTNKLFVQNDSTWLLPGGTWNGTLNPGTICKLNTNLTTDWVKSFLFDSLNNTVISIDEIHLLSDKSYLLLGSFTTDINSEFGRKFISHVDSALSLSYHTVYFEQRSIIRYGYFEPVKSILTNNEILVFCANHCDSSVNNKPYRWDLLETDTSFANLCGVRDTHLIIVNSANHTFQPFTQPNPMTYNGAPTTLFMPETSVLPVANNCNSASLVTELNSAEDFKIFPNPSSGKFTIQSFTENIFQINITNISGQIIYKKQVAKFPLQAAGGVEVDLTNHSKGIYLVQVITDKGVYNQKIIAE